MSESTKSNEVLSPAKQELLALLLKERQREKRSAAPPLIPRRAPAESYPLSFAQQRLWFLDQLVPNNSFYNIPAAIQLSGTFDIRALARSLNTIMQRHESLRTTFALRDGQPVQLIAACLDLPLPVADLRALPAAERADLAQRLAGIEAQRPFDLARGPLIRAALLRLEADEHVVLLNLHHIVADAWSMGVLIRELAALYTAYTSDRGGSRGEVASPLPPLPVQYADYAVWQREWLSGPVLERQLAYWKRQLGGDLPVLELPTDRPRPAFQTFNGAVEHWSFPPALAEALTALSRREDVTLFMLLLAAFQTLLFRYSGQPDVVVGSPIANRLRPEIKELIGFFVNTLALRADLSGDPRFRELLRRVQKAALEAYDHQDLPFEKLVEEIQPQRDPSRSPLFQVMFSLQNVPLPALNLPGLALRPLPLNSKTSRFDIIVTLEENAQGMGGRVAVEYNTDLFDAATITRMLGHYQTLLAGIVADPDQQLAELPLLAETERRQLLSDWNATAAVYPEEQRIHVLFEEQARRTPDTAAVIFADAQLSYDDLNRRANRLAHHLRALGVAVGMRVGICMERSIEMVVGLLGILKAGAAYVPLDPASPAERLAFMLDDAEVPVLLTTTDDRRPTNDQRPTTNDDSKDKETRRQGEEQVADFLVSLSPPLLVSRQVVDLRRDWSTIARQPDTPLDSRVTSEHLGYVIYTSGSTGKPKGVAMSHRALVNLLYWQLDYLDHRAGTRFLQFASLSFDVSYQEIFPTLASGGVVVLITEELRRDAPALWRLLFDQQVERIYLPYVGLQQLAEVGECQDPLPTHLRQITVSGEQLQITRQIAGMFHRLGGSILHNFYGPSESHAVTAQTLTGAREQWPTLVPIGYPIANTQMHVLDQRMQPVPIGVAGELYIGGICLADGYLHRPDLTAERFVPNPFARVSGLGSRVSEEAAPNTRHPIPDTRLYRTGDLARYRPDGAIMFLGRIDGQVKLRGYRIELEEIESVLQQHPQVQESVVMLREDLPGDKRLVAYVVPRREQGTGDRGQENVELETASLSPVTYHLSPAELRAFVQAKLPNYMIPSTFMLLEALPLTINGKVDRQALPAPDAVRPELANSFVEPRTATEALLASIIGDVLRLERVGAEDNFFELGGHSLLAIQVVSRVSQVFRVTLPVRRIFEAPTVAALARVLIASEAQPGLTEKTAQIFQRIRQMSAEDRRQALQQRKEVTR